MGDIQGEKIISSLQMDITAFAANIKTAENLTKTLKTNLRDLSNLRVDAGGNLTSGTKGFGDELGKTNKQLGSGKELMRDFYREQRIQDRTTREASRAVIGFTVGLSALLSQTGANDAATKRFTTSLLTAVTAGQGAEFSAAAIGIAGRNLTGSLGQVAGFLQKNAGMIGLVVGLGTGLIQFFMQVDEKAKKAAEGGLARFTEGFAKLTTLAQADVISALDAKIKELRIEQDKALKALEAEKPSGIITPSFSQPDIVGQEKYDELEKEIKAKSTLLTQAKEQQDLDAKTRKELKATDDALKGHYTKLQDINRALLIRKTETEEGVTFYTKEALTTEQIRKRLDETVELERQRKEILKPTSEIRKEGLAIGQLEYEIGTKSLAQLIELYRVASLTTKDKKERLEYQKKLSELEAKAREGGKPLGGEKGFLGTTTMPSKVDTSLAGTFKRQGDAEKKIALDTSIATQRLRVQAAQQTYEQVNGIERAAAKVTLDIEQKKLDALDGTLKDQQKAKEQALVADMEAGAAAYDANKSLGEQMNALTNEAIRQYIARAVFNYIASIVSVTGPLALVLAPAAGLALQAALEAMIPKFAAGGKATRPTLGIFGEAGPEYLMPQKSFYDVARQEIIPQFLEMAKREIILRPNISVAAAKQAGITFDTSGIELRLDRLTKEVSTLFTAIESLPAPIVQLKNPITLGDGLKVEYPKYQKFIDQKNVD